MSVILIPSSTTRVDASSNGDLYFLNALNALSVDAGIAFSFQSTSDGLLTVAGDIVTTGTGVFDSGSASGNSLVVDEGGSIVGQAYGVFMRGEDSRVTNGGIIAGLEVVGVVMTDGALSQLNNTGEITGEVAMFSASINHFLANSGTILGELEAVSIAGFNTDITNSGTISARFNAIVADPDGVGLFDLTNTGEVSGGVYAIRAGNGNETIINSGLLAGIVDLGGNDDLIDSRNGEINGRILLGSGDDTAILGAEDNFVDGRAGADMIRGGGGDDEIQGGSGDDVLRGGAGDDDIIGEDSNDDVYGGHGSDNLRGNAGADRLFGGTGNDVLAGGSGDDRMNGGRDDDVLTGNGGEDLFIFNRQAGNDEITDFNDGVDLIDLRAFNVSTGDVLAATSVVGGNSIIDLEALGGTGSILIEGDTSMSGSDFLV